MIKYLRFSNLCIDQMCFVACLSGLAGDLKKAMKDGKPIIIEVRSSFWFCGKRNSYPFLLFKKFSSQISCNLFYDMTRNIRSEGT